MLGKLVEYSERHFFIHTPLWLLVTCSESLCSIRRDCVVFGVVFFIHTPLWLLVTCSERLCSIRKIVLYYPPNWKLVHYLACLWRILLAFVDFVNSENRGMVIRWEEKLYKDQRKHRNRVLWERKTLQGPAKTAKWSIMGKKNITGTSETSGIKSYRKEKHYRVQRNQRNQAL